MRRNFKGSPKSFLGGRIDRPSLSALMCEAGAARRARAWALAGCPGAHHRERSVDLLDALLEGEFPPRNANFASIVTRAVTLQQMSSRALGVVQSSCPAFSAPALVARAISVAVTEIVHFLDECATRVDPISVYLAVAREPGALVVGVAAVGGWRAVASADAFSGMMRAGSIAEALGGVFARGADGDRMVFGMTFGSARDLIGIALPSIDEGPVDEGENW